MERFTLIKGWVGTNGKAYFGQYLESMNQGTQLYRQFDSSRDALAYSQSLNGGLPPLGVHIEEEIDIAETLGGPPSQDQGDDPDQGSSDEE